MKNTQTSRLLAAAGRMLCPVGEALLERCVWVTVSAVCLCGILPVCACAVARGAMRAVKITQETKGERA